MDWEVFWGILRKYRDKDRQSGGAYMCRPLFLDAENGRKFCRGSRIMKSAHSRGGMRLVYSGKKCYYDGKEFIKRIECTKAAWDMRVS